MSEKVTKRSFSHQARRYARKRAVQCLYQWQLNPTNSQASIDEFSATQEMQRVDDAYFKQLVHDVIHTQNELDDIITQYTDIAIDKLDPIELCILRLACYEAKQRIEIPYKVILDEAINLTKTFGGEQGHAFVNAVLDKAMHDLRPIEASK